MGFHLVQIQEQVSCNLKPPLNHTNPAGKPLSSQMKSAHKQALVNYHQFKHKNTKACHTATAFFSTDTFSGRFYSAVTRSYVLIYL